MEDALPFRLNMHEKATHEKLHRSGYKIFTSRVPHRKKENEERTVESRILPTADKHKTSEKKEN